MKDWLELHEYADGELTAENATRVKQSLLQDPVASAEVNAILNLKDCVQQKAVRYDNDECWKSCVKRLDEIDRTKRVQSFVGRYAWAMCAIFFGLIISGRYMMHEVRGDSVRSADILRMFSGLKKTAPKSKTAADVDRWLDDLMGRVKPNVATEGMTVMGGETGVSDGRPVVRLDLMDDKGPLTLLAIRGVLNLQDMAPAQGVPPVYQGEFNGVNCVAWNSNGFTLILVGQRSYSELQGSAGQVAFQRG